MSLLKYASYGMLAALLASPAFAWEVNPESPDTGEEAASQEAVVPDEGARMGEAIGEGPADEDDDIDRMSQEMGESDAELEADFGDGTEEAVVPAPDAQPGTQPGMQEEDSLIETQPADEGRDWFAAPDDDDDMGLLK